MPFIAGENVTLGQGEEQNQKALDKKADQISFSTATFDLDLVTDLQFSHLFFKKYVDLISCSLSQLPTGCVISGNLYNIPELSFSSVKMR